MQLFLYCYIGFKDTKDFNKNKVILKTDSNDY